jgi:hypothetical protein
MLHVAALPQSMPLLLIASKIHWMMQLLTLQTLPKNGS